MGLKLTQEVYKKIFDELIQQIREDPILQTQLKTEDIDFLEDTWNKNLKESGIFNSYNHEMALMHKHNMSYSNNFIDPSSSSFSFGPMMGNQYVSESAQSSRTKTCSNKA